MNVKRNIKITMAYDGTHYHGWQRQAGAITLQQVIEEKIEKMTGEPVRIHASGRTDAGVHALNQVCNFLSGTGIEPSALKRGLNSLLPNDIFIKEVSYAPMDFHARYSAKAKTYEYRILNRREPDPFVRHYSWHIPQRLDLEEMKKCMSLLLGKEDFSSFRSSGSGNINPVREMYRCEVRLLPGHILSFIFEANGFLRHMVRNMVGTLLEIGRGKLDCKGFQEILRSRDRRMAGVKAPPQGLFLREVRY